MKRTEISREAYDVIVVGARAAGAATSMLLARGGARVLAVDREPYGGDRLSTHGLMRPAVYQLYRWGLLPNLTMAGTPIIRDTTFHYGPEEEVAVAIKPRDGIDGLMGPRRSLLDRVLVDGARAAGAEVHHGVHLRGLLREASGRVTGVTLEDGAGRRREVAAELVVGADGLNSTVARLTGSAIYRQGLWRSAVLYGYWEGLPQRGYHWYWNAGSAAGLIPTNDGLTCVFAATTPARFAIEVAAGMEAAYRAILAAAAPSLVPALPSARRHEPVRGFGGVVGYFRQAWGPGWALVGDAGYFKDPLTAHGLTDALRDAEFLARAVIRGGPAALAGYQEARDAISAELFRVTDEVASFEWDLPRLKDLHMALHRAMVAEQLEVQAFDLPAAVVSAQAAP